jgi:hypothetical protein
MKTTLSLIVLCLLFSLPARAEGPGFQDTLLDHLAGSWVLEGTIGGAGTTHDIVAEWVLGHYYLRFHEVSREKDDGGEPAYEAIVFIGWDQPSGRYACLWLDSTGGSGLSAQAVGHAKPDGDKLAFLFEDGEGGIFHTTFIYDRESDSWDWRMDAEKEGELAPFARVSLTRKQSR